MCLAHKNSVRALKVGPTNYLDSNEHFVDFDFLKSPYKDECLFAYNLNWKEIIIFQPYQNTVHNRKSIYPTETA